MYTMLFYLMMTFLCNAGHYPTDTMNDVESFVELLSETRKPMLSDYYRFYGKGAEDELKIALTVCKRNGWTPVEKNEKCINYIKNRRANSDQTSSFYLLWLRTKLPLSPNVHVLEVKRVTGERTLHYELITATLNNVNVVFFRPIDPDKKNQFGLISITEINGISVHKILEEDLHKKGTKILRELEQEKGN